MLHGVWSAEAGMQANKRDVDTVSVNIANLNTPGYRNRRLQFSDLLYRTVDSRAAVLPNGGNSPTTEFRIGHGARLAGVLRSNVQGALQQTERSLDLAIEGRGFFTLNDSDDNRFYTRDGRFDVDGAGWLVGQGGRRVLDADGRPVRMPENFSDLSIDPEGVLEIEIDGERRQTAVIGLSRPRNPGGLEAVGGNLLIASENSGPVALTPPGKEGSGTLRSGFIEAANVDLAAEMTRLIVAQRAYSLNAASLRTADQMLQLANGLTG